MVEEKVTPWTWGVWPGLALCLRGQRDRVTGGRHLDGWDLLGLDRGVLAGETSCWLVVSSLEKMAKVLGFI